MRGGSVFCRTFLDWLLGAAESKCLGVTRPRAAESKCFVRYRDSFRPGFRFFRRFGEQQLPYQRSRLFYGFCVVSLFFIGAAKYGINFRLQAAACLQAAIERVT
mgnify:CR=1 FL=1